MTKLADASLEQLLDIKVVTVSRKDQKKSRAPAAIYVITQRKSGVPGRPRFPKFSGSLRVSRSPGSTTPSGPSRFGVSTDAGR